MKNYAIKCLRMAAESFIGIAVFGATAMLLAAAAMVAFKLFLIIGNFIFF